MLRCLFIPNLKALKVFRLKYFENSVPTIVHMCFVFGFEFNVTTALCIVFVSMSSDGKCLELNMTIKAIDCSYKIRLKKTTESRFVIYLMFLILIGM